MSVISNCYKIYIDYYPLIVLTYCCYFTCFKNYYIININKILLLFKFLKKKIYNLINFSLIIIRSVKSGQGKRQIIIILYIYIDSIILFSPLFLYKGIKYKTIIKKKGKLYSPNIKIKFNKKGYNNKKLIFNWIDKDFIFQINNSNSNILLI